MSSVRVHKFTCIFILLIVSVLLSTLLIATEARPLQGSGLPMNAIGKTEGSSTVRFSLGAKRSGPSPGVGHKYEKAKNLEEIKNSGPSPGEGHKKIDTDNKP